MARDVVLFSITLDPAHDQPRLLSQFAATWKADPQSWHFLTESPAEVQAGAA